MVDRFVVFIERRRRLLISAQGWHNPGLDTRRSSQRWKRWRTCRRIWSTPSALEFGYVCCPRVVASANPGLKLANAFGVRT